MRAPRRESDSFRRSLCGACGISAIQASSGALLHLAPAGVSHLKGVIFLTATFFSMARMLLQAGHLFTILCGRQSSHNRPLTNRQTIGIEKSASVYKSDPPGRKTGFS